MGAATALTGLLLIAMPIAIIAGNFSHFYDSIATREHSRRREKFIRTMKLDFREHRSSHGENDKTLSKSEQIVQQF